MEGIGATLGFVNRSVESMDAQIVDAFRALNLAEVAITATIDPSGRLGPVGGLWSKLLSAAKEAASLGVLHIVVVAEEQPDIAPELCSAVASPLRVLKAATLQDAIAKLYQEHGPRNAVRLYEREQCASINVLGVPAQMPHYYQVPPLFREVSQEVPARQRAEEQKDKGRSTADVAPAGELWAPDILRWEDQGRRERLSYRRVSLERVFADFQSVVPEGKYPAPRFVVVGPPGCGKTTLTQYLSWRAAQETLRCSGRPVLPARVRLRNWELWALREKAGDQNLSQYLAWQYRHLSPGPTPQQWDQWLRRGDVLLLLDGIDEIAGETLFLVLLKATLETLMNCPTVVTCRTVSFDQYRTLCPEMPVFTLAEFDATARDAYVRAFFTEHETAHDAEALIRQFRHNPQLHFLTTNPLLLTITCYLLDEREHELFPTTRSALYRQAVEKLLSVRTQRVKVQYPGEEPTHSEKLSVLQTAALYLFIHGEGSSTFSGQALAQALRQGFTEEGYGKESAPWANALRADLIHNSGLLRGNAEHGFFFLHLAVQEFLAAAALAERIHKQGWDLTIETTGQSIRLRRFIDKKAWNPRWQEVIVFLAGQLNDPLPLLTLLADEKCDDFFRHRLALAALCLPEVQVTGGTQLSAIVNRITATTFSCWMRHERNDTTTAVPHLTHALPALGHANGHIGNVPFLQSLCQQLQAPDRDVRLGTVEALGHLAEVVAQHADVFSALLVTLHDTDPLVRAETTETFRRMGAVIAPHPDVLPALVHVALHDPDVLIRSGATKALAQMGDAITQHPQIPPSLVAALSDENRSSSLRATDILGQKEASATLPLPDFPTLVTLLHSQEEHKRAQAAYMLGQRRTVASQLREVFSALVQATLYDRDAGVRSQAITALGHMGAAATQQREVLPALIAVLHDRDKGIRAQAARALGQIGKAAAYHAEVLPALVLALRDEESNVRYRAAEALGQMMAQGVRVFRRWWGKVTRKSVEELADVHT